MANYWDQYDEDEKDKSLTPSQKAAESNKSSNYWDQFEDKQPDVAPVQIEQPKEKKPNIFQKIGKKVSDTVRDIRGVSPEMVGQELGTAPERFQEFLFGKDASKNVDENKVAEEKGNDFLNAIKFERDQTKARVDELEKRSGIFSGDRTFNKYTMSAKDIENEKKIIEEAKKAYEKDTELKAEDSKLYQELTAKTEEMEKIKSGDDPNVLLLQEKEALEVYDQFLENNIADRGFLGRLVTTVKNPLNILPFVKDVKDTAEFAADYSTMKKYQNGEELSKTELARLNSIRADTLKQYIEVGMGDKVGELTGSMPKYALEFALTSSLYTAGKEVVLKKLGRTGASILAKEALKEAGEEGIRFTLKESTARLAAGLIGSMAQTTAFVPTISKKTAEYMLPEYDIITSDQGVAVLNQIDQGDSFSKALTKAGLTTYIDVATERAGFIVEDPVDVMKKAILGKYIAKMGIKDAKTFSKIAGAIAWDGVIAEVFEEELADLLQAPIEERKYYTPFLTSEGTEKLLVETLGITAFGGISKGIGAVTDAAGNISTDRKLDGDVIDISDVVEVSGTFEQPTAGAKEEEPEEPVKEETLEGYRPPETITRESDGKFAKEEKTVEEITENIKVLEDALERGIKSIKTNPMLDNIIETTRQADVFQEYENEIKPAVNQLGDPAEGTIRLFANIGGLTQEDIEVGDFSRVDWMADSLEGGYQYRVDPEEGFIIADIPTETVTLADGVRGEFGYYRVEGGLTPDYVQYAKSSATNEKEIEKGKRVINESVATIKNLQAQLDSMAKNARGRKYLRDRISTETSIIELAKKDLVELGANVSDIEAPPPKKITKTAQKKTEAQRKSKSPIEKEMNGDFFLKRNADFKVKNVIPARSAEELVNRIDQLNKFAQSNAILRKGGGVKSRTAAGEFSSTGKRGEVRLTAETISNDAEYVEVLAHELGHAMEYNITGSTKTSTYKVFADSLSSTEELILTSELKGVTENLVGKAEMMKRPQYYNRRTELLARFLQKMIVSPADLEDIAPTAVRLFEINSIKHPLLREFTEAAMENIDKGAVKPVLPSLRTMYQKHLGKRVGNIAYDAEIVHRAMVERGKYVIERFVKNKFKDVKDDPALLFKAAESIKITRNGKPVFGTMDYVKPQNEVEEAKVKAAGWVKVDEQVEDGVKVPVYSRTRYTAKEGQAIYESLSDNGKGLIRDFTVAKDEARDYFNREIIKDIHKIEGNIEGWVFHYFEDKPSASMGKRGLKFKKQTAGTRKKRAGVEGYVEDFQKAMTKALIDLESEKTFNDFITDQFARVTKPIKKGANPDAGWVEVAGSLEKGVGTAQEKRIVIVKDGKKFLARQIRYQMPKDIYERYQLMKGAVEEASKATRVINNLNRYWRINILAHAGTAGTNFISGGVQYSAKVLTDFYTEVLTGDVAFTQTKKNVSAMLKVLLPKGWTEDSPSWVYGADLSNYYGQFQTKKIESKAEKGINSYGDKALRLFGAYETYWKKVIAIAENVGDLKSLEKVGKEGLRLPTKEEAQIIADINSEIDLYAYDYDNVPVWLEAHQKSPLGQAIKPFAKYPYKYAQQITEMASAVFDQTIPWQRRMAKLLALTTMMGLYAAYSDRRKKKQQTPEGTESTPARLRTTGRLFIGTDGEGNEIFIRVSKYPFVNITEAGIQLANGEWSSAKDIFTDMLGSIAPVGEAALLLLDYRNKYDVYTPVPVMLGESVGTFVPLTRVLNDLSRMFDPYQRKQTTFFQSSVGKLIPTTDEALQEKLHGEKRSVRIPLEGEVSKQAGEGVTRTTTDRILKNYWDDILLSMLTGMYRTRIDPEQAKAFIIREEKNKAKEEVRNEKSEYEKYLESIGK